MPLRACPLPAAWECSPFPAFCASPSGAAPFFRALLSELEAEGITDYRLKVRPEDSLV